MSLRSLSLKRKQHINGVPEATENFITQSTIKKRILSLKKNKRKNNEEQIPALPEPIVHADSDSSYQKLAGLVSQDLHSPSTDKNRDPAFTSVNNNINEDVNVANESEHVINNNINKDVNETDIIEACENDNRMKSTSNTLLSVAPNEVVNETLECINTRLKNCIKDHSSDCIVVNDRQSLVSLSSGEDIGYIDKSNETVIYYEKPCFSLSFGLADCEDVNVDTKNSYIKKIFVSRAQSETNIDCEVMENSQESEVSVKKPNPKKQAVSVNFEFKKNGLPTSADQSKVLILNTNAIEKLSHVIVQPLSYKSFRRKIKRPSNISSTKKRNSVVSSVTKDGNVSVNGVKLNQTRLDAYFRNSKDLNGIKSVSGEKKNSKLCKDVPNCKNEVIRRDDMSKAARADTARSDGIGRLSRRVSKEENELSKLAKMPHRDPTSRVRTSTSESPQLPSPRFKNDSASSCSPRRNVDSLHLNLSNKTKSNKTSAVVPRDIPHYKIVAGTHFAVDAFCYGEIPGVQNYFLTHFHSDHYSGLKKSFNKVLYCTKITADLCTSRLGVNVKHIHVITIDETIVVDGVDVTPIDANHCPGAVMLLFSLPNGKTLLHTGDFRATPAMESHPAFWNSDIHTIYLDTTYCNPRYDFPTQDQSLEMALHILRQKKLALEKVGKKFSSVLIVCGTYTIGKEKFFLGLARRVGCAVWACPEKERVLQTVERRAPAAGPAAPRACQLHVVPMRDLTHEKLRSYLDSLQGPFSEVVAFKPSGWENGKNTPAFKDNVTIHGIPYSEHSSFSEMIRFVNFLKPKQVVPTVDITGGIKAVQKYFPCPLVYKEDVQYQSKLTDFFNSQNRQQISAVS